MNYVNPNLTFKDIPTGNVGWRSPSNIALVKYWGKREIQLPANPSLSFTLSKSFTETTIEFAPATGSTFNINFFFDEKINRVFGEKTISFFKSITDIFPFINQLDFTIHSKNTFPHSAGIASSASGISAIALSLCEIENRYFNSYTSDKELFKKASYVARLGSGSACRSLYGGIVSWGKIAGVHDTSDFFGSKFSGNTASVFNSYCDSILIVNSGQKKVSSRVGHQLMNSNPFSYIRFEQAKVNINNLIKAIEIGDIEMFTEIVESEALTLHAMMMTSKPYFLLLKPGTISIIDKIFEYRKKTGIPVCFTLDAGPNIHLLYPDKYKSEVHKFINSTLLPYTINNTVIHDKIGSGPKRLEL